MTGKLAPLRGKYESAKALLYSIAEDDQVAELVLVAVRKNGDVTSANFKMTRAHMAYASVVIADWALEDDD